MALDSSSSRTRSITAIGAGAVFFAIVGYYLLSKNRCKKPKKKSKSKTQMTNFENMQSILSTSNDYKKNLKDSEEQLVPTNDLDFILKSSSSCNGSNEILKITKEPNSLNEIEEKKSLTLIDEHDSNKLVEAFSPILEQDKLEKIEMNTLTFIEKVEEKLENSDEFCKNELETFVQKQLKSESEKEINLEELNVKDNHQIVPSINEESKIDITKQLEDEKKDVLDDKNLTKSSSSLSTPSNRSHSSESTNSSNSSNISIDSSKSIPKSEKKNSQVEKLVKISTKPQTKSNHDTNKNTINNGSIKKLNETNPKSKKTLKNLNRNSSINNNNNNKNINSNKANNDKTIDETKEKDNDSDKLFEDLVVYEFSFPRKFCGKLIGKNGVHVDYIRSKTHTQIAVRNDPNLEELQIVCVSGRLEDVDHALDIIRARFPAKHYPQISFKPISKPIIYRRYNPDNNASFNTSKVLVAPNMFVDLTTVKDSNEKTNNDLFSVYVTAVVSAAHVFIQLPTNSSYENLQKLDQNMLNIYNNNSEESIPMMTEPIENGTICVAPTSYGWHRAMVTNYVSKDELAQSLTNYEEECGLATIKFLDYGGYLTVPTNQLRQLRSDFMVLPFQAIECYLDGICPYEGAEEAGKSYLSEMVRSSTLKASIVDYSEDGVPVIKLYLYNDAYEGLDINADLVDKNYAFDLNNYSNEIEKDTNKTENHQAVPQSL